MAESPALEIIGVVPACGASRRMGYPKALLELGGRTFVQRVVDALRSGGCDDVIVTVAAGDGPVHAAARATGATVIENPAPGEGPITSMRIAIRAMRPEVDAFAWLPVDFPLVEASVVRTLRERAESGPEPLVLPVCTLPSGEEKRGHPPILKRTLFGELLDPELRGGARTVVHRHLPTAAKLHVETSGVATDVDTPEEYEAIAGVPVPTGSGAPSARGEA